MKILVLCLALLPALASATQCGYPPYPPYGMEYVCVCNSAGLNCHWILVSKK